MVNQLTEAIQAFFEERNKSWITGDLVDTLKVAQISGKSAVAESLSWDVRCKSRGVRGRQTRLLRTHTRVTIQQVEVRADGDGVDAIVDECVTWVYEDQPDYGVESRIIRHWQKWRQGQGWQLAADVTSSEPGKSAPTRAAVHSDSTDSPVGVWGDYLRTSHTTYDRVRAARYADLWWNDYNPSFIKFLDDDCTNFASQCMFAGNLRMTGGQSRVTGWWYQFQGGDTNTHWSFSWSVANALHQYLLQSGGAVAVTSARELKVGDLIMYDWEGDGRWGHTSIVIDFDGRGEPLVNAHSEPSYHRHYQYQDSRAWTPRTRYAYLRLPDERQ